MASKAPRENIDESKLTVTKPKTKAVGHPGCCQRAENLAGADGAGAQRPHPARDEPDRWLRLHELRLARTRKAQRSRVLRERRQGGGARGTRKRVSPEFFAKHSIDELTTRDDYWLGRQGRLTHPMLLDGAPPTTDPSTGTRRMR